MARPVKETPILTGKDAQRFDDAIKDNENNKISSEEYDKVMASYQRFEVIDPRNN